MTPKQFDALRRQANDLYASQPRAEKHKISLDAIFTSLALQDAMLNTGGRRMRRTTEEEAPQWFKDTLARIKGKGERITASRFLMLAGRFPASKSDLWNVGRWLREEGYLPRKSGGQVLFDV